MGKIAVLFLMLSVSSFAQEEPSYQKVDSLDVLLETSEKLRRENDMYGSLEYAFKAVDYAHELQNDHYLSYGYLLMGVVQYEIIDYENATKNFLKSLEYSEKTKDKIMLPYVLHSLANIYYDGYNDYEKALEYYKQAVILGKKNPHIQQYRVPLQNFVWTLMDLNRFEEAVPYLREIDSIEINIPDTVTVDRSSLYLIRARNYAHLGNVKKAEENFDKSYEYLKDPTYWPKGTSYFYRYRAQMYEEIGNYTKAISDLKKLNKNERIVFENAKFRNKEITKIRFKVDQYEQELEAANREKALLQDIDKKNKRIILISSIALLMLILVAFFYYRAYRSKKKISQILTQKNSELFEAKSQAEKLNEIKSRFISNISHELRTPLYGVVGITSILVEKGAKNKKDQKLLNSLKFSAGYLLDLVNKVLKVSKIDAEKNEPNRTPTDLFSLSENILLSFEYQAHKKNNELVLKYDDQIPKLINMDALRLSEILMNLIGNANKFTTEGTIWLRITLVSKDFNTARIRYEVEDSGIGIAEDQKDRIFEEFAQVGSIYENKQGTGLGLSIVKNLLQQIGSEIHFESTKNKGSKFYFVLDTEILQHTDTPQDSWETKEKNNKITARILVVEDNKVNQLVTKNLLTTIGCTHTIAENGLEAINMLKKESFDLILMDLNMPVMNGMEATLKIREFNTTIPIIALTASELSEVADDCKKAGMNDLINKPLHKNELKKAIENCMDYKY